MCRAYCGFDCSTCPVYGFERLSEAEKEQIRQKTGLSDNDLVCRGCASGCFSKKLCGFCSIRPCARGRGLPGCWACEDYPCNLVESAIVRGTAGRTRLDGLRADYKLYKKI